MNMQVSSPDTNALFSVSASPLTLDEAKALAATAFGLEGRVTLLTSERDQNFLVETDVDSANADFADSKAASGHRFVLKITHAAESPDVTDFQTQAQLRLMQADPPLPVPHLLTSRSGGPVYWLDGGDGTRRAVRMNTFVSGRPMHALVRDGAMCAALGTELARFDLALSGFLHKAACQELLWDIQHAAKLRPLLKYVTDESRHALASRHFDRFETEVVPRLPALRRQIIHNDLNPYNAFYNDDGTIGGIIDFGDMVEAPLINELAVACAYQIVSGDAPLEQVVQCVAAYHAVLPLTHEELTLLPDLIVSRLLITVAITTWRATLYPENKTYILRNNPLSWSGLETMDALPRGAAQALFLNACGL